MGTEIRACCNLGRVRAFCPELGKPAQHGLLSGEKRDRKTLLRGPVCSLVCWETADVNTSTPARRQWQERAMPFCRDRNRPWCLWKYCTLLTMPLTVRRIQNRVF